MVLEAVVICIDNSAWMRNGDYPPTRMSAQAEAVNYLGGVKTQANEENAVGVLTMAGKRIDVLATPCRDLGLIMSCVKSIKIGGQSNFVAGLKTAQLCLKNRPNKNQRQRIVMFVGSPIGASSKDLVKLGKQLKKNNVSVDVVNFGSENNENDNREILDAFLASVNSSDTSHLVNVPPGPHNLSDMIVSAIVTEGPGAGLPPGAFDEAGMDPELAMAIRMSLEEERQRVAAQSAAAAPEGASGAPAAADAMAVEDDEEAMIAQAIAMSMAAGDAEMTDANKSGTDDGAAVQQALSDPQFLQSLIGTLPEADQANLNVDDILNSMNSPSGQQNQQQQQPKDKNNANKGSQQPKK